MSGNCRRKHHRPTPAQRMAAEQRARASIDARSSQPLTDQEWSEAKANLRQLFGLLASWQLSAHVVAGARHEKTEDE
jgi:hypothetical protein